jgi:hypothetical protein
MITVFDLKKDVFHNLSECHMNLICMYRCSSQIFKLETFRNDALSLTDSIEQSHL